MINLVRVWFLHTRHDIPPNIAFLKQQTEQMFGATLETVSFYATFTRAESCEIFSSVSSPALTDCVIKFVLMSVQLLSSTQAVSRRNKNIKRNWRITLSLWVWEPANHGSRQWPKRKQGTNGQQLLQATLPSRRGPPHFAGGLFTHQVYVRTALELSLPLTFNAASLYLS